MENAKEIFKLQRSTFVNRIKRSYVVEFVIQNISLKIFHRSSDLGKLEVYYKEWRSCLDLRSKIE